MLYFISKVALEGLYKKRCCKKFRNIHMETAALESFLNKVAGWDNYSGDCFWKVKISTKTIINLIDTILNLFKINDKHGRDFQQIWTTFLL